MVYITDTDTLWIIVRNHLKEGVIDPAQARSAANRFPSSTIDRMFVSRNVHFSDRDADMLAAYYYLPLCSPRVRRSFIYELRYHREEYEKITGTQLMN